MADVDITSERQDMIDRLAIEAARKSNPIPATGYCLNCETPLDEGHRWCDSDCLRDWQARNPRR